MPSLRRTVHVAVLTLLLAALTPPADGTARGSRRPPPTTERTTPMPTEESRLLAGRRIVYSYHGPTPPSGLLRIIREGRAAGVILFGENVTPAAEFHDAVEKLRQAAAEAPGGRPLLLMTDQEGGKVRRLSGEPVLSARSTGLAAHPVTAAAGSGAGAGRNLATAGLNTNLAPVLDVYDTPDNFIDHAERSYSQDPAVVAELGAAFVTAQQGLGVAATAKHFPGLGAAARDRNTDEGPVTLDVGLDELRARGEAPYRAAIAAGVRLVMTSWAVYPALDAAHPAGFSRTVVQGELRDRLGFDGVTITDALEAGALASYGDTPGRALAAAEAGMDLLLCSARDVGQGEAAADALATALDSGDLPRPAFLEATTRIDSLRDSLRAPLDASFGASPSRP
ncbi:glycoside hydrolase family 3 N-terminal domain-containing protein [Kitasatospora sp. NPDC127111]|uniref:glycoside hydrolase family 3 N-terminal domain-containing protein n=1 Tax=Kitasatospora sp. NPDC127111 TaxID=3345363 RepID=UPI00363A24BC